MPREQADGPVEGAQQQSSLVVPASRWERRGVLGAGMIGACALGAVAGILARAHDANGAGPMNAEISSPPGRAESRLQIVVGAQPSPPLEAPLRIAASAEPVKVLSSSPPPTPVPSASDAVSGPIAPKPVPPPVATSAAEAAKPKVELAKLPKPQAVRRETGGPAMLTAKGLASKTDLAVTEREKAAKARLAWLAKVERMKAADQERARQAEAAKIEKARAAKAVQLVAATSAKAPAGPKAKIVVPPKPAAPGKTAVPLPASRPAAVNAPASTLDIQLAALRAEPLKVAAPVQKAGFAPAARTPASAQKSCEADSRAEALVCSDARLAAADRRLTAAYRRAVLAGAPPDKLRRQQGRWLAARETAAEEAPWAVAQVYEARIAELDAEAAQAREDD